MIVFTAIIDQYDVNTRERLILARFANEQGQFVEIELSETSMSLLLQLQTAAPQSEDASHDEDEDPDVAPPAGIFESAAPVRTPAPARSHPGGGSSPRSSDTLVLKPSNSIFQDEESEEEAYLYGDGEEEL